MRVSPGRLQGEVEAIPSKSYAHRLLVAAALSDKPTRLFPAALSGDIGATCRCLRGLGAGIDYHQDHILVSPLWGQLKDTALLDCGDSGTTLRLLLPLAAYVNREITLSCAQRLGERPHQALLQCLREQGASLSGPGFPLTLSGGLRPGVYALPGNLSSQYFSGLMFTLPLLDGESRLKWTTPLASAAYVDMTREVLRSFGITLIQEKDGYLIPGNQRYVSPGEARIEGDWSNAAYWLAARALGHSVEICGLDSRSIQGDRAIVRLFSCILSGNVEPIDLEATPDLMPILCVAAALSPAGAILTGLERLRLKESDRLLAMEHGLGQLGLRLDIGPKAWHIPGGQRFSGGRVEGFGDHRIVMAFAMAALFAHGPVYITDSEAVGKSYPGFWRDFRRLGGIAHEQ